MKIVDVIPLYKSKSKEETNNYRLISLLITMSKILEKVIYTRTYNFLEKTDQIFKSQYSFRSKHSCELAVSELLSEVIKSNESGLHTIAVYLDLSKAFDTIDHKLLLAKLELYGIRGIALDWFRSYLENRQMRAKCNTVDGVYYSKLYNMEYGTPQGSCLGPLLFLIFTNDLHLNLQHCICILFADDTTVFFSHRNLNYCEWCIQADLLVLQDWFRANKLTLNVNKSVCMHFASKESRPIQITIDSIPLPVVTNTKFLGIWIDNRLKWQYHLDQLCLNIIRNTQLLRMSKNHLNTPTKVIIYYAHIYSHLVYGCTTWGNMIKAEQIKKLQKLQNRCISLISNKGATNNVYQSLKIMKILEIIKLHNLKLGFKVQHSQLPAHVLAVCKTDATICTLTKHHSYNTRRKNEQNHPKPMSKWYQSSLLVKSICSFQSLPSHL